MCLYILNENLPNTQNTAIIINSEYLKATNFLVDTRTSIVPTWAGPHSDNRKNNLDAIVINTLY